MVGSIPGITGAGRPPSPALAMERFADRMRDELRLRDVLDGNKRVWFVRSAESVMRAYAAGVWIASRDEPTGFAAETLERRTDVVGGGSAQGVAENHANVTLHDAEHSQV